MSKLSMSLDDLISADRGEGKKGGGRGGGAMRNGRGGRDRGNPYSRGSKGKGGKGKGSQDETMADDSGLERRGRGNFQYGKGDSFVRSGAGAGGAAPAGNSLYVGNLPWSADWRDLKDHLNAAGGVGRVDIAVRADGKSRGFAIVQFESKKAAGKAIKMFHDTEYEGRTLLVKEDDGSSEVSSGGGGGKGRGGGGGGGGGFDQEEEDGYSHSGRTGRNGWVKPEAGDAFDDAPPPEPKSMLR